jgi:alkylated DNA repair dioxygenase AlkB
MFQQPLFDAQSPWPEGFAYAPDFLTVAEEAQLLKRIAVLALAPAEYKDWRARRRIVSFGGRYDFAASELRTAPPLPDFLLPLRAQAAAWAHLPVARVRQAMIAEYRPATQLGWHRDVPNFEEIIAVSLCGAARMRLRPWPPHGRALHIVELAPRSVYVLKGAARWHWQHAISPTKELRYSITFRTVAHVRGQDTQHA